jgi:hypothetical protein
LDGLDRPALVYHSGVWYPASIPELSAAGDPIGMAPMLMASAAPAIDFDLMDSIAALCDRLDGKRENCTPGIVRKYCRDLKDMTDSEIMGYFDRLDADDRATLDRTGKTPKLVPNAHFVAAVAATAQAL